MFLAVSSASAESLQTVTTRLTAFDATPDKQFGRRVSVDGDTLVAGAPTDDGSKGAVYFFVRDGASWTFKQKLTASDAAANAFFGSDVAILGDLIIVGSRGAFLWGSDLVTDFDFGHRGTPHQNKQHLLTNTNTIHPYPRPDIMP